MHTLLPCYEEMVIMLLWETCLDRDKPHEQIKGQIDDFNTYHENLLEWIKIANEYKIPTFVLGVGLGGLIVLNLLEKAELPIEGVMLLSPMLELRKTGKVERIKLSLI